jgi:hypothetical protein
MRFASPNRRTPVTSQRAARAALLLLIAGSSSACDTVLGLSQYTFRGDASASESPDASTMAEASAPGPDAAADVETVDAQAPATDAAQDATTCDVDLTSQCYPCAPKITAQFLNACTKATCVPFDDGTRVTRLLVDGGLPPLPTNDAGPPANGGNDSSDGDTE